MCCTFSVTLHPHTAGTVVRGNLGFSILSKDTSPPLWLMDDPLYRLSHSRARVRIDHTDALNTSDYVLSHKHVHTNTQTLYEQVCCFPFDALKVTGHLSLVVPLCVVQDKHPAVSIGAVDLLSCHISDGWLQETVHLRDGGCRCAVQQPQHHAPVGVGGAAGKPSLLPSQDSQCFWVQLHLSSSCWRSKHKQK